MKHSFKTYKYVKQEGHDIEFEIPTETIYLFETGIRRSIKVIPHYTTWQVEKGEDEEEIWKIDFICVYNNFRAKIEKHTLQVSRFESIYNSEDSIEKNLLRLLISGNYIKRTQEQFESDFYECLRKLTE